jgi:hypothetical protein
MDEDQLQAYQLALSGHNLLILRQAGTGKTFFRTLLTAIIGLIKFIFFLLIFEQVVSCNYFFYV